MSIIESTWQRARDTFIFMKRIKFTNGIIRLKTEFQSTFDEVAKEVLRNPLRAPGPARPRPRPGGYNSWLIIPQWIPNNTVNVNRRHKFATKTVVLITIYARALTSRRDRARACRNLKIQNAEIGRTDRLMGRGRFGMFAMRKHFSRISVLVSGFRLGLRW